MKSYEPADISNPQSYANPEKFDELFIRLRKENPIAWVETEDFRPFWAITKYADIVEILSKPENFTNAPQRNLTRKKFEEERLKKFGRLSATRGIHQMDPPDHAKYRNLTKAWFEPANLLKLKEIVREIVRESISHMASYDGQCDFAFDIARPYPLRVIMKILGLPREDEESIFKNTMQSFSPEDPEVTAKSGLIDFQTLGNEALKLYFKPLVQDRKANPKDDLLTLIAKAEIDGQPIPELEQLSYLVSISSAGHDSTSQTIAGSFLAFAQNPALLQQIKNDLSIIPFVVEEMLRWTTVFRLVMRTAVEDYEIRGQRIKAGDLVGLCLLSGNRDEEAIKDPFTIRFDRKPNRHIAFGFGSHTCLGMHLARLEIATFFEELIPKLESLQFGEFAYTQSSLFGGLKQLHLKYKMKA